MFFVGYGDGSNNFSDNATNTNPDFGFYPLAGLWDLSSGSAPSRRVRVVARVQQLFVAGEWQ